VAFQLMHINVQRFRGGLVFKAHRLLYHSTLGLRVIKKKKRDGRLHAPFVDLRDVRLVREKAGFGPVGCQ
jgi:hypothetical protein